MDARGILDWFVRSDYFATWQSERIESGAYSRDPFKRDRYSRCYDAAEYGADGSTHAECLDDMRQAFRDYLRDKRNRRAEYPFRLEAAVSAEIDAIEAWHTANGSIDEEIG